MQLQLGTGDIHVWCRPTCASDYETYRLTLSHDELTRCDRFCFERDRHDYANAHDLLRRTLSRYGRTTAGQWRFDAAALGKPFLAPASPNDGDVATLTFNLSHTRDIVACVVARGIAVGIDIERADRLHDVLGLATRFFSPPEVAGLHACVDEHHRLRRFIELWTLKESFIKAIGRGLCQSLDSFTFDLQEDAAIGFIAPPEFADRTWWFAQYEVSPGVLIAVTASADHVRPFVARRIVSGRVADVPLYRTGSLEGTGDGPAIRHNTPGSRSSID